MSTVADAPLLVKVAVPSGRSGVEVQLAESSTGAGKAAEPESLPLALIGAVVGDSDAIAIFFDRNDQKADTSEIAAERRRSGSACDGCGIVALIQFRRWTRRWEAVW